MQQNTQKYKEILKKIRIIKTKQNQYEMKTNGCPRLSESRLQQWRRRLMENGTVIGLEGPGSQVYGWGQNLTIKSGLES